MSLQTSPLADRRCLPCLAFALLLSLGLCEQSRADDASPEHAQLAAALRHLDMIERLVDSNASLSHPEGARYHFDYDRLHADIRRMRSGIQDYLSPSRAQPRDPARLLGDYQQPVAATLPAEQAAP